MASRLQPQMQPKRPERFNEAAAREPEAGLKPPRAEPPVPDHAVWQMLAFHRHRDLVRCRRQVHEIGQDVRKPPAACDAHMAAEAYRADMRAPHGVGQPIETVAQACLERVRAFMGQVMRHRNV
ncbi:MAG TPA: hypothetical protein VGQ35_19020 [Dongiaceae bacterium]|nr:hypothetical protein [Dongiaceae bacterium]